MTAKARYVATLLERYRRLPGTLGRVLRDDRTTAGALHDQHIDLDVVHQAFILAVARRTFCADPAGLPAIRSLRYFLPVIDEITRRPLDPVYLHHLRCRLHDAGIDPPAEPGVTAPQSTPSQPAALEPTTRRSNTDLAM